MHVDEAEELCQLLDLRKQAAEKLKVLEPGSDGYQDALKAVVDLSKAIDAEEKRYFEEWAEKEKMKTESNRIKADQEARRKQFEEELKARKKEFWFNFGAQSGLSVTKLLMSQGQMNLEYGGKMLLTGQKAKDFTRDATRVDWKKV